jgi:hypothetical protein
MKGFETLLIASTAGILLELISLVAAASDE